MRPIPDPTRNPRNTHPSRSWSFHLVRLWGINVRVHATFLLLLAFMSIAPALEEHSLSAGLDGLLFTIALFSCVVLHEYGHALTAKRYGIRTRGITLLPIGGVAHLERIPEKPAQELWMALAGPAVNGLIALLLFTGLTLTHAWSNATDWDPSSRATPFAQRLLVTNLVLIVFNLLPAFPMDGGRVLRALLAFKLPYARATRIAAYIGRTMAAGFLALGFFGNPMLCVIGLFVWISAGREAKAEDLKHNLRSLLARDTMTTSFQTLDPADPLEHAVDCALAGPQRDFPVVANGQPVGILPSHLLRQGLRDHGPRAAVAIVMLTDFPTARTDQPMIEILKDINPDNLPFIPVTQNNQLAGLLTPEAFHHFANLQASLNA